jgi:outer membrane lipoprotein carrier protein
MKPLSIWHSSCVRFVSRRILVGRFYTAGILHSLMRFRRFVPSQKLLCAVAALLTAGVISITGVTNTVVGSEKTDARRLIALFESRYRSAKTLQATFLERYTDNGSLVRTEAGIAFFRRSGKMRWEYESPEKDVFLVDGKTAWFYVPSDHTVMRVPAKQSSDWRTPLALLAGEMRVSRVCARVDLAPAKERAEREENVVLRCELRGAGNNAAVGPLLGENGSKTTQKRAAAPRVSAQGDQVLFEIARTTGELQRLQVRQGGGVEVEFRFKDWLTNPPVPESKFQFAVPVGVTIVNGELPARDALVK